MRIFSSNLSWQWKLANLLIFVDYHPIIPSNSNDVQLPDYIRGKYASRPVLLPIKTTFLFRYLRQGLVP